LAEQLRCVESMSLVPVPKAPEGQIVMFTPISFMPAVEAPELVRARARAARAKKAAEEALAQAAARSSSSASSVASSPSRQLDNQDDLLDQPVDKQDSNSPQQKDSSNFDADSLSSKTSLPTQRSRRGKMKGPEEVELKPQKEEVVEPKPEIQPVVQEPVEQTEGLSSTAPSQGPRRGRKPKGEASNLKVEAKLEQPKPLPEECKQSAESTEAVAETTAVIAPKRGRKPRGAQAEADVAPLEAVDVQVAAESAPQGEAEVAPTIETIKAPKRGRKAASGDPQQAEGLIDEPQENKKARKTHVSEATSAEVVVEDVKDQKNEIKKSRKGSSGETIKDEAIVEEKKDAKRPRKEASTGEAEPLESKEEVEAISQKRKPTAAERHLEQLQQLDESGKEKYLAKLPLQMRIRIAEIESCAGTPATQSSPSSSPPLPQESAPPTEVAPNTNPPAAKRKAGTTPTETATTQTQATKSKAGTSSTESSPSVNPQPAKRRAGAISTETAPSAHEPVSKSRQGTSSTEASPIINPPAAKRRGVSSTDVATITNPPESTKAGQDKDQKKEEVESSSQEMKQRRPTAAEKHLEQLSSLDEVGKARYLTKLPFHVRIKVAEAMSLADAGA
jgi:hypothetical protein